jgi:hypothetical protein
MILLPCLELVGNTYTWFYVVMRNKVYPFRIEQIAPRINGGEEMERQKW